MKERILYLFYGATTLFLFGIIAGPVGAAVKSGAAAAEKSRAEAAQKEQHQQSSEAVQKERKKAEELREPIIQAAKEGLEEVRMALRALEEEKEQDALNHLQNAVGKLDIAVAANPELEFAAVDSEVYVIHNFHSNEDVKKEVAFIEDQIEEGNIQMVRQAINALRDEMVVETKSLPLGTYPSAIKKAVAKLAEGRRDEARAILASAMNTLVVSQTVFPLPVLRAKDAIERASKMDKTKKGEVQDILEFAEQQLKKAELLGYVQKDSENYENLEERIENLQEEVEGKNEVEQLYEELKTDLNKFWQNLKADWARLTN